jgi:thymidylate synthase (FAD)
MLRQRGHFAMFDHAHAGVRFEVDRGVSHEIVRHRIGVGYAQESTRYCAYKKEITFILPPFSYKYPQWEKSMLAAEEAYLSMLRDGASPEVARSVLPMSLRTELFVTGSFTYWRHLFELRAAKAAHPAMREVMLPLLGEFIEMWPAAFDDLKPLTIVY